MDIFNTLVWCATFVISVNCIPSSLLYDYTSAQLLPNVDDVSSREINLVVPIVFYGIPYSSVFVNSNGLISFQTEIPNFFNTEFPLDYAVIAPFYSNVDTTSTGTITYYETNKKSLLRRATNNVHSSFSFTEDFEALNLFIVTWEKVGYHKNGTDLVNTFQVAISTDGEESYVEFLYPENGIQWIQGTGDESGLPDARAQVGFISEDGHFKLLPGSGTDQVKNLAKWSNMNVPGQWIYRIGHLDGDFYEVEEPDINNSASVTAAEPKTCAKAVTQCHTQAKCIDYPEGFCCECKKNYYGNGKYCIKKDVPLRVNGKVNGKINDEPFSNLDLQSYIVMVDGRAYTAFSRIPTAIGYDIQSMQILGATIGWVFAKPVGNSLNGYQITGGVFNQTATITFPNSKHEVTVRQKYFGLDVFDQLKLEADVKGTIPSLPEGSRVVINEYQEQYRLTAPGVIQSSASHEIRYTDSNGQEVSIPYHVTQSILFDYCKYDSIPVDTTWKLRVGKNFISYEDREQIIRFGLSNKIGPVGDIDPCEEGRANCGVNSACVVEGDSYRCICNPGYQPIYKDNQQHCQDLNECLAGLHDCDYNAQCINEVGSYSCVCDPGFEGDGRICQNALTCHGVQCPENAQCVEKGVAMCECMPGFTGNFKQCVPMTSHSCHIANNCSPVGYCTINPENNEYSCVCLPGYHGDGYSCYPIPTTTSEYTEQTSEVTSEENNADPHEHESQTALPLREYQRCLLGACWCPVGYEKEPDTKFCILKGHEDEGSNDGEEEGDGGGAEGGTDGEGAGGQGTSEAGNSGGGQTQPPDIAEPIVQCYQSQCFCPHGYTLNERTNSCKYSGPGHLQTKGPSGANYSCKTLNNCNRNAECALNIFGKYECICIEGYEGDGNECTPIEVSCARDDICHVHAQCKYNDQVGKSECICNTGYQGNGINCQLVVTASCISDDDCPENELCKYSQANQAYECSCKDNLVRDSQHTCVKLEGNCGGGTCVENAECLYDNEYQTYYCYCKPDFIGDGITECKPRPIGCNVRNNCGLHAHCQYLSQDQIYQCQCDPGFFGDGFVCYSQRNCLYEPNMCDSNGRCVINGEGQYVCECNPGFRGNGSVCNLVPKHDGNFLLMNQGMATLKIPFDETKAVQGRPIQIKFNQIAVGLDVDCFDGRVYWSDVSGRAIRSSLYNGTNKTDFLTKDIGSPEGLAIDFISRNIYWTDSTKDTIEVANIETRLRKTLFNSGLVNPRGIAIHPQRGKIFWTDWDRTQPKIEWANMDGTGREIFLRGEHVQLPNALAIDYATEQLCYTDAGTKKVECIDIDGKHRRTVAVNCTYPFGIAVTEDTVYYSDWISKKIERIQKHTFQRLKPLSVPLGGSGNKLYSLVSVPDQCPQMSNVCYYYKDQCRPGYICMPNGQGGRKCVCASKIDHPYDNSCNEV